MLTKFCRSEHNVLHSKSIFLGTLHMYRSIENHELQDSGEGKFSYSINFPEETELSLSDYYALSLDCGPARNLPAGRYSAKMGHVTIIERTESAIIIKGDYIISYEPVNCFIFCMSKDLQNQSSPFSGYSDQWSVSCENAQQFADFLANLLVRRVQVSDFDSSLQNMHLADLVRGGLVCSCEHGIVSYEDRLINIYPDQESVVQFVQEKFLQAAFIKPARYAHENEYRFIFNLTSGRTALGVKSNGRLLRLESLPDYLSC